MWLVPPVVVTCVAMVWVSWLGREGRGEVDRDVAVRRLAEALQREEPGEGSLRHTAKPLIHGQPVGRWLGSRWAQPTRRSPGAAGRVARDGRTAIPVLRSRTGILAE